MLCRVAGVGCRAEQGHVARHCALRCAMLAQQSGQRLAGADLYKHGVASRQFGRHRAAELNWRAHLAGPVLWVGRFAVLQWRSADA